MNSNLTMLVRRPTNPTKGCKLGNPTLLGANISDSDGFEVAAPALTEMAFASLNAGIQLDEAITDFRDAGIPPEGAFGTFEYDAPNAPAHSPEYACDKVAQAGGGIVSGISDRLKFDAEHLSRCLANYEHLGEDTRSLAEKGYLGLGGYLIDKWWE